MSASKSNTDRLYEAGLITKLPIPDAYQAVLEGLDAAEVSFLVSLSERLKESAESLDDTSGLVEYFVVPL